MTGFLSGLQNGCQASRSKPFPFSISPGKASIICAVTDIFQPETTHPAFRRAAFGRSIMILHRGHRQLRLAVCCLDLGNRFLARLLTQRPGGLSHWLSFRPGEVVPQHPLCTYQVARGTPHGVFYNISGRLSNIYSDIRKILASPQFGQITCPST